MMCNEFTLSLRLADRRETLAVAIANMQVGCELGIITSRAPRNLLVMSTLVIVETQMLSKAPFVGLLTIACRKHDVCIGFYAY